MREPFEKFLINFAITVLLVIAAIVTVRLVTYLLDQCGNKRKMEFSQIDDDDAPPSYDEVMVRV